ncbi:MAG: glycosyltransferase family 2 protein [Candidatus Omnitrophica bacterium]|nr:glycosyltransferase family 2 protein [Candidatus Omnitrophota bacterium]
MELIFRLSLLVIIYAYCGYPLLTWVVSLVVSHPVKKKEGYTPEVTFLITAYNEEKNIRKKLRDTLALSYPRKKLEIMVASDGSEDSTDAIVKEFEPQGVRLFRVEGRVGKTETQNRAVQAAGGEIIIFSDTTTTYRKDAIGRIVRNYADPAVGAVSGRYRYLNQKENSMGTGSVTFWDYENFIKTRQTRIQTITGCCGCIYSVRKSLYVSLPPDIISDLVEPLKILEQGYRIVFEPEALAYETSTEASPEEFRMRVRVISRGMHGLLYVKRLFNPLRYPFVSFQLFSHKVLRWLVPWFAAALLLSSLLLQGKQPLYYYFAAGQTLFYLAALWGWLSERMGRKIKLFSLPLYFCVLNAASAAALMRTLQGKKAVTWKTVR